MRHTAIYARDKPFHCSESCSCIKLRFYLKFWFDTWHSGKSLWATRRAAWYKKLWSHFSNILVMSWINVNNHFSSTRWLCGRKKNFQVIIKFPDDHWLMLQLMFFMEHCDISADTRTIKRNELLKWKVSQRRSYFARHQVMEEFCLMFDAKFVL